MCGIGVHTFEGHRKCGIYKEEMYTLALIIIINPVIPYVNVGTIICHECVNSSLGDTLIQAFKKSFKRMHIFLLIHPRCAERATPGRGKPVLIMHIGFFACFHAISHERSRFSKIFSCPCSTEIVAISHKPAVRE